MDAAIELIFEPYRSWKDEGLHFVLSLARQQSVEPSIQLSRSFLCPASWNRLLPQNNKKVVSIWTYFDLAFDLDSSPCQERRTLWANILHALHQPKGSILFWPFNELSDGHIVNHVNSFWEGVQRFQPSHITIFGRRAFETLFPGHSFAIGEFHFGPFPCLILPGPEDMLPDNKDQKRIVWQHLVQFKM